MTEALGGRSKWVLAMAIMVGVGIGATSVAIANHEDGHSKAASGRDLSRVKVVGHSFPVSQYLEGQWSTSSTDWVDVPGAQTSIKVPRGQRALIVVRFSPNVICTGSAICETQVVIGDKVGKPNRPVYFNVGDTNHWGVPYTERSLVVGSGTHTVKGQIHVSNPQGTAYVRSHHLTVERFQAG